MKTNKKGISLIVLVITIVVMIILASAIILSISSGDIRGKANEAVSSNDMATAKEIIAVAKSEWELNYDELKDEYKDFEEYANKKLEKSGIDNVSASSEGEIYKDPVIPTGFVVSGLTDEQSIEDGLVVYEIPESERSNINWNEAQTKYNQYVWVPVTNIEQFKKIDWKQGVTGVDFQTKLNSYDLSSKVEENEYNAMMASVEKYGGFYIARYEAGTPKGKDYEDALVDGTDKPLSQKGANPWMRIAWDKNWTSTSEYKFGNVENNGAAKVARNAYDTNVKSTLMYGEQWDAALKFISKVDPVYPTKAIGKGWFYENSGGSLNSPGRDVGDKASNKLKNIYDMAGNIAEITMETYDVSGRVVRGLAYDAFMNDGGAGFRAGNIEPNLSTYDYFGFRVALYIK